MKNKFFYYWKKSLIVELENLFSMPVIPKESNDTLLALNYFRLTILSDKAFCEVYFEETNWTLLSGILLVKLYKLESEGARHLYESLYNTFTQALFSIRLLYIENQSTEDSLESDFDF